MRQDALATSTAEGDPEFNEAVTAVLDIMRIAKSTPQRSTSGQTSSLRVPLLPQTFRRRRQHTFLWVFQADFLPEPLQGPPPR